MPAYASGCQVWYVVCVVLLSSCSLRGGWSHGQGRGAGASAERETHGEWVLLLHVTDGYMDFLHNFLAWYTEIEHWSVQHAVKVVVSSNAAAQDIASAYGALKLEVVVGSHFGQRPLGYNDKAFTSLVQQRPSLILEELLADRNVLYLDVDVVLLADPFPSLTHGYDIWTAMDHPHVHCTGVLAITASRRTIDFLSDWESAIQGTKDTKKAIGNQQAFNLVVDAEEHSHLDVLKLSQEQFPPGSVYFSETAKVDRSRVLAVHNNFIVGHAAKKRRFVDHGLWRAPSLESVRPGSSNRSGSLERSRLTDDGEAGMRRHPDDSPVTTIFPTFASRVIKLSVENAVFPVVVSGVVEGCVYGLQWSIYGNLDGSGYSELVYAEKISFDRSSSEINLTVPAGSVSFVGRAELQVYVVDRFPGLSQDDAFLSSKRRIVELWSPGCVCSVVWPLPRRSDAGNSRLEASEGYRCDEVPWTFNATNIMPGGEVTLATIASISRLPLVLTVAELWDAPMSVAVYARTRQEEAALRDLLHGALSAWLSERENLRVVLVSPCYMDEMEDSVYTLPINVLRHHAVASAGTDLVLYIDVDYLPSADAASLIRKHVAAIDFRSEVLVVPCFEQAESSSLMGWPRVAAITRDEAGCADKTSMPCNGVRVDATRVLLADLLEHVGHGRMVSPGVHHASTDYPQWLGGAVLGERLWTAHRNASYQVSYTLGWEPYLVVNKTSWRGLNTKGLYDQRFREKGWDNAAFVYEVAARGYSFRTLHRVFLVHAFDDALGLCPQAFGSDFCSTSEQTADRGWGYQERSRQVFASFIRDISQREGLVRRGEEGCQIAHGMNSEACVEGGLKVGMQGGKGGSLDVQSLYLPAAIDSWCLIYPFQVMKGLQTEVIDGWLNEAYGALAVQLRALRTKLQAKLAFSCAKVESECRSGTRAESDLIKDWTTRSEGWKGFFDRWCLSVPALVGQVRQLGDSGLVLRVDSRVWEGLPYSLMSPATYSFRHYMEGMNGVQHLDRGQLDGFRVQLTAEVRLSEYCVEMMDQEQLWRCVIKTVIEDKDGNPVSQLKRDSVLLELVEQESPSELLSRLAVMEVTLSEERRQRQAADEALLEERRRLRALVEQLQNLVEHTTLDSSRATTSTSSPLTSSSDMNEHRHPPVSIHLQEHPLVCAVHNDTLELTFTTSGLVALFSYEIVVLHIDPHTHGVRQAQDTTFVHEKEWLVGSSLTNARTIKFIDIERHDFRQRRYRSIIEVRYHDLAGPSDAKETGELVARKDFTTALRCEEFSPRKTGVAEPEG